MRITVSILFLLIVAGCASKNDVPTSDWPIDPNTMIFAKIQNKIDALETSKASPQTWQLAADSTTTLNNFPEVKDLLNQTSLSPAEVDALSSLFKSSSKVVHYGFECNYHSLVFFDNTDIPSQVIKW